MRGGDWSFKSSGFQPKDYGAPGRIRTLDMENDPVNHFPIKPQGERFIFRTRF